ncbi:MAG: zinc metallopeptidase [Gammaproteobacteria bacterium]|nr:zinc metallopeptidase [Gammaproteobacteria bacterium]
MRWRQGRRSTNVEDRRGRGPGRRSAGGPMKIGGGAGILLIIAALFFGQDITGMLGGGSQVAPPVGGTTTQLDPNDEGAQFISTILADTEDVWTKLFQSAGQTYQVPKLVMFEDGVNSACGFTSSAAGPFYCPGDSKVYIDLSFFREMQRMQAIGDFAQAYVLAHEVGHHVQNLLGVSMAVQSKQRQVSKVQANRLSVLTELQADCYAGVWAHHAHKDRALLEPGDLEEGMNAASKIGDDALMASAGRRIHPDAFTHGSSKQRQQWLYIGLESGDPNSCDTFGAAS